TGRSPTCSARSATRALRLADRTEAYVATARITVPPAVAREEIVVQSATAADSSHAVGVTTGDGLLAGVRILDLSIWRPGPYATQLLAELDRKSVVEGKR